jgi:hypothetical protein
MPVVYRHFVQVASLAEWVTGSLILPWIAAKLKPIELETNRG